MGKTAWLAMLNQPANIEQLPGYSVLDTALFVWLVIGVVIAVVEVCSDGGGEF